MKFKVEKNERIVNELISYFYKLGSLDISFNLKTECDNTTFTISGPVNNFSEKSMKNLSDILNTPRQREVEAYYWHLGGESQSDSELTLVGMMIDTAELSYIDGILSIKLLRKE